MSTGMQDFQEYEKLDNCPICHGKNFAPYFFDHLQYCPDCGSYFQSPRPTQAEIKRSYDSGVTYAEWEENVDNHIRQFQVRLNKVLRYATKGKLLDVGIGNGLFLKVAQGAGFEVSGTELSEPGNEYGNKYGFSVKQGQLTDIDFGSEQFDVITIWHVLEHVPDAGNVLKKIHGLLRPGGIFAVAVPNETRPLHRLRRAMRRHEPVSWKPGWGCEIHLNHFVPSSLRHVLNRYGFQVVDFGMDDVYPDQSLRSRGVVAFHAISARLFQWHFGKAMYFIARKPQV